ncbi:unnamed protein product [Sphagnum troendelagicum]|uniref:Uncharacterized protein n=1 Tax=Sphagnum troendelagicum TaxID=128251 RepID=A0ABP0U7Q2_9BRYO
MGARSDCHFLLLLLVSISWTLSSQSMDRRGSVSCESMFGCNFWSTVDAHHYKLLEDGEVAELVLDSLAASGFASNTRYPEPHPECSWNAGIHSGPELQEHNSDSHQNPGHTSSL